MRDRITKKQATYGRVFIVSVLALSFVIFLYVKFFSNLWSARKVSSAAGINSVPATAVVDTSGVHDRFALLDNAEPIVVNEDEFSLLHISNDRMQKVSTVYVIPGGGSSPQGQYPEWTKRRVIAAKRHFDENHRASDTAIFLALSAGSLNSPNSVLNDNRIRFECQHTIQHLLQLGVPRSVIFGDTFSWDTVTNGLTLRMLVEGLQEYRAQSARNWAEAPAAPPTAADEASPAPTKALVLKDLSIEVFISDFHADRVRASFAWILSLAPRVQSTQLHINVVDSIGVQWQTPLDYTHRIAHEAEGTQRIQDNAKKIKTLSQFYAFLTLGGHQGLHKYVHYDYETSKGGGWK